MKKKKKKDKDIFIFSKRLKLNHEHKNLINYLTRNSKAVYNTALYYARKILNKDNDFLTQYNNVIFGYKGCSPNMFTLNGLIHYVSKSYDNYKYMTVDISQQTIKRVYKGYSSFFALIKKSIPNAKPPNYLDKGGRYNIIFTKSVFKKESINNKYYIRLTLGKYIQKNYIKFTKNDNLKSINDKKYYSKNYIIDKKNRKTNKKYHKINKTQYVPKDKVFNGMHFRVLIPKYIYNKDITEIEIKPISNGLDYTLIVKYNCEKIILNKHTKKSISIDFGLNNLLTIFGLQVKPFIINGRVMKSINQYYNKKIAKIKSKRDLILNRYKKELKPKYVMKYVKYKFNKRIKILFNRRSKKLNSNIHKITRYLTNYCVANKIDTVIIGYIKGWKQNANMGKQNNQNFCYMPFLNIINKLKYKLYQNKIKLITRNESYTSKCDALSGEPVGWHCRYKGRRIKRGLFKSGYRHTLLNADVNAAINIYRKTFINTKEKEGKFLRAVRSIRKRLQQVSIIKI